MRDKVSESQDASSATAGQVADGLSVAQFVAQTFERGTTPGLLRNDIFAHVKTLIVSGQLPAGTRIRDGEIARELGVSRTPVREAVRKLQDEGFIEAEASRWTRVAPIATTEADEIYPIVGALERLCVTRGGLPGDKVIDGLRAANDKLEDAIRNGDAEAASDADNEFHSLLTSGFANERLHDYLSTLKGHLHRFEVAYFGQTTTAEQSIGEHAQVIDALASGDDKLAAEVVEMNWTRSLQRMHERLEPQTTTVAE